MYYFFLSRRSDESPFTFGTAQVEFAWESDKTDVLALRHSDQVNGDDDYGDNDVDVLKRRRSDFSVWSSAMSPGKSKVKVVVTSIPLYENEEGKIIRLAKKTYQAELVVVVESPLVLVSRPTLLLWPGAVARIRTNLDGTVPLSYRQSTVNTGFPEIVKLVNDKSTVGCKIVAGTVPGRSTVYVMNKEEDQSVVVNIEVRDVAQLRIEGRTHMHVGEEVLLDVVVVDDMGRRFNMDALDMMTVENLDGYTLRRDPEKQNMLRVHAAEESTMTLKIHMSDAGPPEITVGELSSIQLLERGTAKPPKITKEGTADVLEAHTHLSDYVLLTSVYPMVPSGRPAIHLHVGGTVNFTSASKSQMFRSSDQKMLRLLDPAGNSGDSKTGATRAEAPGQAYIKHKGLYHIVHKAKVIVHRVESITMNTSSISFVVPSEKYIFPVQMFGANGSLLIDDDMGTIRQNIQLDCRYALNQQGRSLDENAVHVTSSFDPKTGRHACELKIDDTSQDISQDTSQGTSNANLFPMARSISIVAVASDAENGQQGTSRTSRRRGTYKTGFMTFDNYIPFFPNLRTRVRYPHDVASMERAAGRSGSGSKQQQQQQQHRGNVLLGCVELQPRTPFAYVDVYVRSDKVDIPLDYTTTTNEIMVERVESIPEDPPGWTRVTYKISARNREVAFKEMSIEFAHVASRQNNDVCVTYGQVSEYKKCLF